ncbi:hypothetical protein BH18THE1_BH18THE1_08770 [soil metagenome]
MHIVTIWFMSKNLTPENFLGLFVDELNKGNISYLLPLYEKDACFVTQLGEIVTGQENIRQNLQNFINMKGKLETVVKNVFRAGEIALVISNWSLNWIAANGKALSVSGKAIDVLREQSDGTWSILIDNPWGTEISR